ncbi:MAG: hypothetical protein IPJ13_27950 [Saprospiraceae bacterium]|nr:hypothetical protein [Saprospiraceae bacterium]
MVITCFELTVVYDVIDDGSSLTFDIYSGYWIDGFTQAVMIMFDRYDDLFVMVEAICLPDFFYKRYYCFIGDFCRLLFCFIQPLQIDSCTVFILPDGVYIILFSCRWFSAC